MPKLWGGRFAGTIDPHMESFNASISYDKSLCHADIRGSVAYAEAICKAGIITKSEAATLAQGLHQVDQEWLEGTFQILPQDEDIHTANERRLTEIVGAEVGGKLHTGRSRNDQVATDLRLWLLDEMRATKELMTSLLMTAVARAETEINILMPGYTHLQPAQPIRWSHWVMSHAWAWERDLDRLKDMDKRVRMMPLGSGALAGNPFGVDRPALAQALGFGAANYTQNSLDSVSDRDFVAEFLFMASLTCTHLSRWAEDLVLYSSQEFGFVEIADAYSTGSSLMPQKKNPDALELIRGKAGRTLGALTTMLVVMKGIPTSYNKDLQEDKEALFDTARTLKAVLHIAHGVLATLTPKPERMRSQLTADMLATDLADYLVRKGVPFRQTHHISGQAVLLAEKKGCSLTELTLPDLHTLHPAFEADVMSFLSFERSVELRSAVGGTSREAVQSQIAHMKLMLKADGDLRS